MLRIFFSISMLLILAACGNKNEQPSSSSTVIKINQLTEKTGVSQAVQKVRGEVEFMVGTSDAYFLFIMDDTGGTWLSMDVAAPGAKEINLYSYGEFDVMMAANPRQHPEHKGLLVDRQVKNARRVDLKEIMGNLSE